MCQSRCHAELLRSQEAVSPWSYAKAGAISPQGRGDGLTLRGVLASHTCMFQYAGTCFLFLTSSMLFILRTGHCGDLGWVQKVILYQCSWSCHSTLKECFQWTVWKNCFMVLVRSDPGQRCFWTIRLISFCMRMSWLSHMRKCLAL